MRTVQQDEHALKNDTDKTAFGHTENVKKTRHDSQLDLGELKERPSVEKHEQEVITRQQEDMKQHQRSRCDKVNTTQEHINELKSEHGDVQRRVNYLEDQQKSKQPQINYGNLNNSTLYNCRTA